MSASVCIVGVGGGGGKVVDCVAGVAGGSVRTVMIDTDAAALADSCAVTKVRIGSGETDGYGTGGDWLLGRRAADRDVEMIRNIFADTRMAFVVVGLGGGTGTGAVPVVLDAAREAGALTLCFATLPFQFEGRQRAEAAAKSVDALRGSADVLAAIPNERLCMFIGEQRAAEVFERARRLLADGVCVVARLITQPGFISLGFADLQRVARGSGGMFTFGYGDASGDGKAEGAVDLLLDSPLIGSDQTMAGARSLLVAIAGGPDMTLVEIGKIMDRIQGKIGKDCHLAMGTVIDEDWTDRVTVVVLASDRWAARGAAENRVPEVTAVAPESAGAGGAPDAATGGASEVRMLTGEVQQTQFRLESFGRGRFKNIEPTLMDGEDLDIPTFVRRGIVIEK